MNNFTEVLDTITRLIDSKKVSNYRIQKDTGVSYGAISELRNGKRKIKNLTLDTAEKLYNYQKALEKTEELEDKIINLETPHNILSTESVAQYFVDIENNGKAQFNIEYALLNKVEHDNGKVYYEVETHRTEEVPFDDLVEKDNIKELEEKWLKMDQQGDNYIESIFFENEEDAKDYITLVLKGFSTFEKAAKESGVLRDSLV